MAGKPAINTKYNDSVHSGDSDMNIVDDNVMVCTDCIMVIANGDYSGLDYLENRVDREAEIDAGLDAIDGHIVPGDSERDREFSKTPCDCCGSTLAGHRHHCVILGY